MVLSDSTPGPFHQSYRRRALGHQGLGLHGACGLGLRVPESLGFIGSRVLGFRVLGFCVQGFRVLGFREDGRLLQVRFMNSRSCVTTSRSQAGAECTPGNPLSLPGGIRRAEVSDARS